MAVEKINVNSGTGPAIACDQVGTNYYQVVKVVQAADGDSGSLSTSFAIAGTVSVSNTPTVTISNSPVVITGTVAGINVTVTSGSFSVVNTPTVTATISGTPVVTATISNAVLAISGTVTALPSGTQNVAVQGTPVVTATISNALITATGSVSIANTPVVTATISNSLLTVTGTVGALFLQKLDATNDSILAYGRQTGSAINQPILVSTTGGLYIASGGGGGAQYGAGDTSMGATGTGTMIIGLQSGATTGRALVISTSGGLFIASGGGGGVQYGVDTTAMNATGTGTLILGMQTGATTARGIAVTVTGQQLVQLSTGTVNVVNTVGVIGTAHASRWDAFAVNTTSGSATIVKTSGAHTLYVTDLIVSVNVPGMMSLLSAATTKWAGYLAANGGVAINFTSPMVLNSNQSLTFQHSVSGSASCYAAGYTVT